MQHHQQQPPTLKFTLCGSSGVGKTSIILRFVKGAFLDNVSSTIGIDMLVKKVQVNGELYKLVLVDTAGQERFNSIGTSYGYKGCKAIIFVYSIDSRPSFDSINSWIDVAQQYCDNPNFVGCIIGNKLDLDADRQVTYEEGLQLAQRNNFMFLEVSARAKVGIDEVFEDVLNQVVLQQQELEQAQLFQQLQTGLDNDNGNNNNNNINNNPNHGVDLMSPSNDNSFANSQSGGCC